MRIRQRLAKLEARRRLPGHHHTEIVTIPSGIDDDAWESYLNALPCKCGVADCPQRTIGLAIPEKMTADEW